MNFENNNYFEKTGKYFGFILMFFLFSTILYFVLNYTNKIPDSFQYYNIFFITVPIILIGSLIKLFLK